MRRRLPTRGDGGAVTAETAVALPVLVMVLVVAMWAIAAAVAHVQAIDAARSGVRALARGEPVELVRAAVAQAAPDRATIRVEADGDLVRLAVAADVPAPGPLGRLFPALGVSATAVAAAEPAGQGP